MAYRCPDCGFEGALQIKEALSLPPDSRSDDIILQIVVCDLCKFYGAAVYEESRRGSLDSESWDHTGYRLEAEEFARLISLVRSCPEQKNERCHCKAHRQLGKKGNSGRWVQPAAFDWQRSFPMRWSRR